MRRNLFLFLTVAACAARLSAAEPSSTETSNAMAWVQFVALELRELRRELAADRVDRQEARVSALGQQLQQARLERQQGEELLRVHGQELLQLDQQLADPAIPAEERSKLQAVRGELVNATPKDRETSAQREAQITDALRNAQLHLERLRAAARALAPAAPAPQKLNH